MENKYDNNQEDEENVYKIKYTLIKKKYLEMLQVKLLK